MTSASSNYATLDTFGRLPNAQTRAGLASGLAELDADALVPPLQLPAGNLGRYLGYAENDAGAVVAVTLPTFTNYLTLSTPVTLPAGNYLILWHYVARHDNANTDVAIKVHVTGATVAALNGSSFQAYARWEQSDPAVTQTPERMGGRVVALNAGINNVHVDVSNSANSTNIRRAALMIMRWD